MKYIPLFLVVLATCGGEDGPSIANVAPPPGTYVPLICDGAAAIPYNAPPGLAHDCSFLIESIAPLNASRSLNWSTGTNIYEWDGITLVEGRVTGIDLRDRGLNGYIPNSLNNLFLEDLYLAGNDFTGCIPHGLLGYYGVPNNDLDQIDLSPCHPKVVEDP